MLHVNPSPSGVLHMFTLHSNFRNNKVFNSNAAYFQCILRTTRSERVKTANRIRKTVNKKKRPLTLKRVRNSHHAVR